MSDDVTVVLNDNSDVTITTAGPAEVASNVFDVAIITGNDPTEVVVQIAGAQGPQGPSVSDGDKGDISVTGSGTVWTIDANAVTYPKQQDVSAASRLLGRGSAAGAGDPEEITLGTNLSMSGTTLNATGGGGSTQAFGTIAVSGQSDVVAEAAPDTLTLVAGTGVSITTNAATDTITLSGTVTQYTDELAQDAVGGILTDSTTIDFTYDDGLNTITAIVKDGSITYTKIQNVSVTDRILGRDTAGAGPIEELTVTGGLEFTGTGIRTSAFTGDVTKSAGGTALTIANDAVTTAKILDANVTYAKIQDITAASRLLGRGSAAGAGDVEEIVLGTNLSMSGTTLNATGGAPGGADTQVQFNDGGVFGGDSVFIWDKTANRLVIGHTAATTAGGGETPSFQVHGTTANTANISVWRWSADNASPRIRLNKSRGAVGSQGIVSTDDAIGQITWAASDGAAFINAAAIFALVDAAPGLNDMPGRLTFETTPDGGTATVERLRIDRAGTVVIGGRAAGTFDSTAATPILQVHSIDGVSSHIGLARYSANANPPRVYLAKSRGTTITDMAVVQAGDFVGDISFEASDGTRFINAAQIRAFIDGTPGDLDMPGGLLFSTTADGNSSSTERMRITQAGKVVIANAAFSAGAIDATFSDANFDVIFGWDDSASTYKSMLLADILTEGAPAAGDFLILYGAEGDMRKVNWSSLPGGGGGINNVVEDTTPELGGDLETNNNDIVFEQYSADAVDAEAIFVKSRNAAIGSHTIVANNDSIGTIRFQGSNGTTFDTAALITAEIDGTPGATTDMPGRLSFLTTPDASVTPVERLRIDSTGILRVNTANPAAGPFSSGLFQIAGTTSSARVFVGAYTNDGSAGRIAIGKSLSGSLNGHTTVIDGSLLGAFGFYGSDGTAFREAASITANVDGTPGASDMPGRLVFNTSLDGSASPTEHMRIDNVGHVIVSNTGAAAVSFDAASTTPGIQVLGQNDFNFGCIAAARYTNNANPPRLYLAKSRGTTSTSFTVVQNGDFIGDISFEGADGTRFINAAQIRAIIDGTPGDLDMPGALVFATTADGNSGSTDRMRIDSAGMATLRNGATLTGHINAAVACATHALNGGL